MPNTKKKTYVGDEPLKADPARTTPARPKPVEAEPLGVRVQYAALPWRRGADGQVRVLLITSRETRRWVIPKGWPMKHRTPGETAAQEAYEEAGVTGLPAARPLGRYVYGKRMRDGAVQSVTVRVFALEVMVEQLAFPERQERDKLWTSPADAAERVDEPELKAILRAFRPRGRGNLDRR